MAFIIRANNKDYEVSLHAANRMMQRGISEEMVVATLEYGEFYQQAHGTDLYEYQLYDDLF